MQVSPHLCFWPELWSGLSRNYLEDISEEEVEPSEPIDTLGYEYVSQVLVVDVSSEKEDSGYGTDCENPKMGISMVEVILPDV